MLRFDALLERIEGYGTAAAGPTDLFLALLRLEPTPPERTTELQGLSLDLWSPGHKGGWLFTRSARRAGNAIELVRRWIDRGGLPGLATRHEGATVAIDPVQLPVDIGAVPGIPAGLLAGHRSGTHDEYYEWGITGETGLGIAPAWPDLLAAKTQLQFDQSARFPPRWLPLMAHAPAPGLAVHHDLAATLCHADEDHRLIAVESALTLMGRGLWDASAYTDCCLHMLTDGVLRLGRLGHSWEQLILAGGLQPLWPTAMAVLDAASSLERKPAGLADVIGDLRRFVSAVPDPQIPKSVQALAVSKGSSKARIEAEAFVSAAQRRHGVTIDATYRAASALLQRPDPTALLELETALGATPVGLVEQPRFFSGMLARPDVTAAAILAVADVANSRYFDAGLIHRLSNLDPVVTASGDRLRFEAFSLCNGVHARLDLLADGIDSGEVAHGTTNVDINQPLRTALAGVGSSHLVHLDVGTEGLSVATLDETHHERTVDLPDRWIRGFAETPSSHRE